MQTNSKRPFWWIAGATLLLVAGFALPRHLLEGENSRPVPAASTQPTVPPALQNSDTSQSSAENPLTLSSPAQFVEVYVCGAVRKPGVYKLRSGARVTDGITKAGGALTDADLDQLNLAEIMIDAMKLMVPHKGQPAEISSTGSESLAAEGTRVSGNSSRHKGRRGGRSHKLQPGQWLNINTATESELTALPGVGPSLARRIVEYRQANGPFQTIDDLQNVSGIGASKLDKMSPYVRL